ncbi:MAG: hypothetical protein KIY11_09395 [Thermoplasmata archaeon]|nr:hypothetical protein [Candidatus Sysuiplasma acidicola]
MSVHLSFGDAVRESTRRWKGSSSTSSSEVKLGIINEGMQPGATVTEISRRHNAGLSTHHHWK